MRPVSMPGPKSFDLPIAGKSHDACETRKAIEDKKCASTSKQMIHHVKCSLRSNT